MLKSYFLGSVYMMKSELISSHEVTKVVTRGARGGAILPRTHSGTW
jgi:hypothetical protein